MTKREGWICPKCQKVYAPEVMECASCNAGAVPYVPYYPPYVPYEPYRWPYNPWWETSLAWGANSTDGLANVQFWWGGLGLSA